MKELLNAFSGGEVSPVLAGRVDLPGMKRSCRRMRGFIAGPAGAAFRRPPLLHVGAALAGGSVLIPFNAGTGAAFQIELGHRLLRVYNTSGQAEATVETGVPWMSAQIHRVQYVQSNDVLWLTHPEVEPHELLRTAAGWVLQPMAWEWPPLRAENLSGITLKPTAKTGLIDLVASAPVFADGHKGAYWQISHFREVASADLAVDTGPPASAVLAITGIPAEDQTTVIGNITYRWKATPVARYDLKIQADADNTVKVLVKAINGDTSPDVFAGTKAHPAVTAGDDGKSTGTTNATATLTINVQPAKGVNFTNLFATSWVDVGPKRLTAVASGATAGQFNLGTTQEGTLDNIRTAFNALSGTTGASFDARQGRSIVLRATAGGLAGNNIAVSKFSGNSPSDAWLRWTDANGAAATKLTGGTASDTFRLRVTSKVLGPDGNSISVGGTMANAVWSGGNFLTGGSDVGSGDAVNPEPEAVSNAVTIKGTWNFTTLGRWQGTVYIEQQDAVGNWQVLRQFNGKLDVNRTAEGVAETPTVFRIRVAHLAGAAASDIPSPRFLLEAAENIVHGIVRIKSVEDSTHATAEVVSALQDITPTPNWREGAYSTLRGFPAAVALHEERLIFAGSASEPQNIRGSGSGDFRDFEETGLADGSWQWPFTSRQAHPVHWMVSGRGLIIGTAGNERVWDSGEQGITPLSPPLQRQLTFHGSDPVMPAASGDAVLFVQRGGRAVLEYGYEEASGSYIAPDLTQLVEHLTSRGVKSLAVARSPFSMIWAVTHDGQLLACTYARREEVVAWCPQPVGGVVHCVSVLPGATGSADEVWIVVERFGTRRIERFDPAHWTRLQTAPDSLWHLDAAVSGSATGGALANLGHLEGQAVKVIVNGVEKPDQTVLDGRVTIPGGTSLTKVTAGIPNTAELQPALFDVLTETGTSTGRKFACRRMHIRFHHTRDCQYQNNTGAAAYDIPFRDSATSAGDQPPPAWSGLKTIQVDSALLDGVSTVLSTSSIHPLNVLNVVPEFELYGE